MDTKKSTNRSNKSKKGGKLIKILVMAVVLIVVALGGIILSDVFFSDDEASAKPETVTVTVSNTDIFINGTDKVSLSELENYFSKKFEQSDNHTVVLINDTKNPADVSTYNKVVEVLSKFGINHQTLPATDDEPALSTIDES